MQAQQQELARLAAEKAATEAALKKRLLHEKVGYCTGLAGRAARRLEGLRRKGHVCRAVKEDQELSCGAAHACWIHLLHPADP